MAKFIEFTNLSNEEFKGEPLLINIDHITTIFEQNNEGSRSTCIYSSYQGKTWVVEETYGQVRKMIKEATDA